MPKEDSNNKEQDNNTCESCSIDFLFDAENKDEEEEKEEKHE